MLPFVFVLPPDPRDSSRVQRTRRLVALLLVSALLGLGILLFADLGIWALLLIVPLVVILLTAAIVGLDALSRQRAGDKRKRRPQDADMYTLIDRMVGDLNEDEVAYLRRRLDELEAGLQTDLPAEVTDLLDQRKRNRRAGRR
jgi:hypothetical protein